MREHRKREDRKTAQMWGTRKNKCSIVFNIETVYDVEISIYHITNLTLPNLTKPLLVPHFNLYLYIFA